VCCLLLAVAAAGVLQPVHDVVADAAGIR